MAFCITVLGCASDELGDAVLQNCIDGFIMAIGNVVRHQAATFPLGELVRSHGCSGVSIDEIHG